jgi:hypothetical protein
MKESIPTNVHKQLKLATGNLHWTLSQRTVLDK